MLSRSHGHKKSLTRRSIISKQLHHPEDTVSTSKLIYFFISSIWYLSMWNESAYSIWYSISLSLKCDLYKTKFHLIITRDFWNTNTFVAVKKIQKWNHLKLNHCFVSKYKENKINTWGSIYKKQRIRFCNLYGEVYTQETNTKWKESILRHILMLGESQEFHIFSILLKIKKLDKHQPFHCPLRTRARSPGGSSCWKQGTWVLCILLDINIIRKKWSLNYFIQ